MSKEKAHYILFIGLITLHGHISCRQHLYKKHSVIPIPAQTRKKTRSDEILEKVKPQQVQKQNNLRVNGTRCRNQFNAKLRHLFLLQRQVFLQLQYSSLDKKLVI
jgi:hypothetical protein